MFSDLEFDELITPTSEVKLSTAFREGFDQYDSVNNPTVGGGKIFAFDNLRLLEEAINALTDSLNDLVNENF